jgi:hypothetical protein
MRLVPLTARVDKELSLAALWQAAQHVAAVGRDMREKAAANRRRNRKTSLNVQRMTDRSGLSA